MNAIIFWSVALAIVGTVGVILADAIAILLGGVHPWDFS